MWAAGKEVVAVPRCIVWRGFGRLGVGWALECAAEECTCCCTPEVGFGFAGDSRRRRTGNRDRPGLVPVPVLELAPELVLELVPGLVLAEPAEPAAASAFAPLLRAVVAQPQTSATSGVANCSSSSSAVRTVRCTSAA